MKEKKTKYRTSIQKPHNNIFTCSIEKGADQDGVMWFNCMDYHNKKKIIAEKTNK